MKTYINYRRLIMKTLVTTIAAITLGTIALSGFAAPYGYGPYGYGPYGDRAEIRLERLANNLNLNKEQQQQIKAMLEKQVQERQATRGKLHDQIKSVLNEEQQARFTKMHEERQQWRAARMAGRDGSYCDQRRGPGRYWQSGN
jgi:Spy/CpxP family protein refolding chaperone